jgi:hypothetical protein
LPWLRSIDGFNTHDDAFELAMSGGVTSIQALPGSGNAIGNFSSHCTVPGDRVPNVHRWSGIYDEAPKNIRTLAIINDRRASTWP